MRYNGFCNLPRLRRRRGSTRTAPCSEDVGVKYQTQLLEINDTNLLENIVYLFICTEILSTKLDTFIDMILLHIFHEYLYLSNKKKKLVIKLINILVILYLT